MSRWRFIVRSLLHHWRINLAVALGVMAATAVLTGALLIGDSVRGSLRRLTLERLGRIDEVLVSDRFFHAGLVEEIARSPQFSVYYESAAPAIIVPRGSLERTFRDVLSQNERTTRSSGVLVVGCDESFWELGEADARPRPMPAAGEIVLNRLLADDLGAAVGDRLTLRLEKVSHLPTDSPLGRKTGHSEKVTELKVVAIIAAESLGRFSMRPSQGVPRNAYVHIETLQQGLQQTGRINAILVAGHSAEHPPPVEASAALAELLRPSFDDLGFTLSRIHLDFWSEDARSEEVPTVATENKEVIYDYLSFTSDRMIIEDDAAMAAQQAFARDHVQSVFTYLATAIGLAGRDEDEQRPPGPHDISYSTITAIDSVAEMGPLLAGAKPIDLTGDGETQFIVLNSWAAKELGVEPKARIRVWFFDPETTHGQTRELSADFQLKAIVPLTDPDRPYAGRRRPTYQTRRPTLVNDPDLTPVVEGITDQDSMTRWEAPFPVDQKRVNARPQDDTYWQNHRTTPKAFVSLATGQRLWGSRFGKLTSLRIPLSADMTDERIEQYQADLKQRFLDQLARDGTTLLLRFEPVKRNSLQASKGATPFDVLFLMLSMFIIAAALMLVALLFRLGIEHRAAEVGTLLAVGLPRRLTAGMLMIEGTIVASLGGVLGVVAGIGYAWLMIIGLSTWWVGAINTPFLQFYLNNPWSLLIGYASGVLVSVLTIGWSIRGTRRLSVRRLLAGQAVEEASPGKGRRRVTVRLLRLVALLLLVAAVALGFVGAFWLGGEAQAGAFLGCGASVLAAVLMSIWIRLRYSSTAGRHDGRFALFGLAARNAGRNPSRSTLTMGLVASASFLIVAVGSFRLAHNEQGAGGFSLYGESDVPIYQDLNSTAVRNDLLDDKTAKLLEGRSLLSLRVKPGDDASCNNLYKVPTPRVLGITSQWVEHFDRPTAKSFSWAATAAMSNQQRANPWRLLNTESPSSDDVIPVVIDKNTAMYSLGLYGGVGDDYTVTYGDGTQVQFRVVGLLSNSILQGNLLIGNADFIEQYPQINGYNYFLIDAPQDKTQQVSEALEARLSDQGLDVRGTGQLLVDLMKVQNTYLDTFQSLGALGLLLGTFGLATVQLRNVLERRGELALMRAAGFRRTRLARMVMIENALLLAGGLLGGVFAALVAVVPHWLVGGASAPGLLLVVQLLVVLTVGLLSGVAAVRAVLRAPLLSALRGD